MDNLFVIHKLKELLAIDSPLGMHRGMDEYLLHQAEELGFAARRLHKGGVLVELGGHGVCSACRHRRADGQGYPS